MRGEHAISVCCTGRRRAREREVRGQGEVESRSKLNHGWKLKKQNMPGSKVRAGSRSLRDIEGGNDCDAASPGFS